MRMNEKEKSDEEIGHNENGREHNREKCDENHDTSEYEDEDENQSGSANDNCSIKVEGV